MAFYDQLGSFFTAETEEERRRREEEEAAQNAVPFKQTIVTDPVTGKQTMKMEGAVEDFTAANPMTPTVTAPVAPEMGPPREAMMPEVAGTPGFNPAAAPVMPEAPVSFSDIRGQEVEIKPQVGGEPTMTAAAPATPTAPAGGEPTMSMAQQELQRRLAGPMETMPEGQMGPAAGQMGEKDWATTLSRSATDPQALATIRADKTAPEWVRKLAAEADYKILQSEKTQEEATKLAKEAYQSGNFNKITREMRKEGGMGDWLKYMFFKSRGYDEAAGEVAERLGLTDTYQTIALPDGRQVVVKAGKSGLAKAGVDATTGKSLTSEELDLASGSLAQMKGAQTSARRVRDQQGTEWSVVQTPQGPLFYDNNRRRGTPTGKTVDIGIGSDLDLAQQREMITARAKLETLKASERIKTWESLNAVRAKEGKPLFSLGDLGLNAAGEFVTAGSQATQPIPTQYGGTTQPAPAAAPVARAPVPAAQPVPATTPVAQPAPVVAPVPPTPVAPTTTPPAAAPVPETTGAIERTAKAREEVVKKASEIVSKQADIVKDLNSAQRNIKLLESGRTNFGTIIGQTLPGERAVGKLFQTKDAVNTNSVIEFVNKLNASNVKALGTNPTDRDLLFVTASTPDETWNEADVAEWIRRSEKGLRNTIRIAREQVRTGGAYEEPLPAEDTGEVDTNNPLLKKKKK